jgi:hypothetical protein
MCAVFWVVMAYTLVEVYQHFIGMLVDFRWATWCYNSEDCTLLSHHCEDLRFSEFRIFHNKEPSDLCRSYDKIVVARGRRLVAWLSDVLCLVQLSSLLHMFTEKGMTTSLGLYMIFLNVTYGIFWMLVLTSWWIVYYICFSTCWSLCNAYFLSKCCHLTFYFIISVS